MKIYQLPKIEVSCGIIPVGLYVAVHGGACGPRAKTAEAALAANGGRGRAHRIAPLWPDGSALGLYRLLPVRSRRAAAA